MNQTFQSALERAKTPGSAVLNAWRSAHGPEATRSISNLNETRQQLTVQELANIIGGGAISNAGPVINETTAMKVSAVYACVALIAGAISTLPLPIYERTTDGFSQPGWGRPLFTRMTDHFCVRGIGRYEQVFIATTSEPAHLPPATRYRVCAATVEAA